jgi:hypothetical protein
MGRSRDHTKVLELRRQHRLDILVIRSEHQPPPQNCHLQRLRAILSAPHFPILAVLVHFSVLRNPVRFIDACSSIPVNISISRHYYYSGCHPPKNLDGIFFARPPSLYIFLFSWIVANANASSPVTARAASSPGRDWMKSCSNIRPFVLLWAGWVYVRRYPARCVKIRVLEDTDLVGNPDRRPQGCLYTSRVIYCM